jgi:hypothetical protein
MGGVAGCHTVPISSTKVSITSQIGAGRGAVRPGFERGRLVIANVAVQECRLGEFVRGGMTCRHEKAKDLLGKLIAKQGDQITCLGRGSCRSGGCVQAHDASAGAYLRTLAYARISLPCRLARETIMLLGLRLM